jgi:hypothetical protein
LDVFRTQSLPLMTRPNYLREMQHLIPWSFLAGLVEGQFGAIVVTKTFQGSTLQIAIASATPIGAMTFSLFWGALCVGRPKIQLASLISLAVALLTGMVAAIPSQPWGANWFIAQMAAAQLLLAGTITIRSAIWKSNYPRAGRGRITARLQGLREMIMVCASMTAAALCDRSPLAYQYVYPAAALLGLLGVLLLTRIRIRGERSELSHALDTPNGGNGRLTPTELISPRLLRTNVARILTDDTRFARYLVAQLCVGFSNQLTHAVAAFLIARELDFGEGWGYWISAALLVALPRLLLFGTIGRWGRLFDRLGVVRFRVINILCWLGQLTFGLAGALVVVYPEYFGNLFIIWAVVFFAMRGIFWGLGMGGGKLAWTLGHLHFAPKQDAEIYMGIHVSLTGLRGLIAPLAGMALWNQIGWWVWIIAIAIGLASLVMFLALARQEAREGMPVAPGDLPV